MQLSNIDAKVEVNADAVNALFRDLNMTDREATKAVRAGLREAMNIVRRSVRRGVAGVSSDRRKQRGVGLRIYRDVSGAQVNIYSGFYLDRANKKKVFVLRWLEEGTKAGPIKRGKTRKDGGNRMHGATPAKPFFNAAATSAMPQAQERMSTAILKHIQKVADKRK